MFSYQKQKNYHSTPWCKMGVKTKSNSQSQNNESKRVFDCTMPDMGMFLKATSCMCLKKDTRLSVWCHNCV